MYSEYLRFSGFRVAEARTGEEALEKAFTLRPDVILMAGYENDYVGILRAARVLKPAVKAMVGVWSLATPKMAAEFPDLMP